MEYVEIIRADGTKKTIHVDHSVQPKEKLNYNELAQYHREMSQKSKTNGSRVN